MTGLKKVAAAVGAEAEDILLTALVADNRSVVPGALYVALKGRHFDARQKIAEAASSGAAAVIYEDADDGFVPPAVGIPCIPCKNLEWAQADIADAFYNSPSKELELIGVTGTNGKSTTTHLVAEWASAMGKKTAVMGTLGTGFYPHLTPSANTTLRPIDLERILREERNENAEAVALEVSSQGLALGRVRKLNFRIAAFTNLSRDHLDFHKTMENYAKAKFELFKMVKAEDSVINVDDPVGRQFLEQLPGALSFSCHELKTEQNIIFARSIVYHRDGITVQVDGSYGNAELTVPLIGSFNAENLLCSLGIVLKMGFSMQDAVTAVNALHPVAGRMECFRKKGMPLIIVDYAHTPDGLAKALAAINEHHFGKTFVVGGCGGDRDHGKRPQMAEIATRMADYVVMTNDNPRTEDPMSILKMMKDGIPDDRNNYDIIPDRKEAILHAVSLAAAGDVVLIAGKGHEDYQIIGTKKIHYSDRELATNLTGAD